jgi:hypothetical protein
MLLAALFLLFGRDELTSYFRMTGNDLVNQGSFLIGLSSFVRQSQPDGPRRR